jgi:hypothetical protein
MRVVINFVKNTPITVASAVIALIAVGMLVFINVSAKGFVTHMATRNDTIKKIDQLGKQRVTIPPENPDQPPRVVTNVAINQKAIDDLDKTYKTMAREYNGISKYTEETNSAFKRPMLDGLFPSTNDLGKLYEAKVEYRRALLNLLGPYAPGVEEPRLDAGLPVTPEEVDAELATVQTRYLTQEFFPPKKSVDELTNPQDKAKLVMLKRERLVKVLEERANSIHIYAQTNINTEGFPFTVGEWSKSGPVPTWQQLWEGQVGLWMQEDIAKAIAWTNRTRERTANVINMPIKRLIKIDVQPSGLNVASGTGQPVLTPTVPPIPPAAVVRPGAAAKPTVIKADEKLPDNYTQSVTGRQTNVLYDVRRAKVSLIIETERMPEFFNNLSHVNFITVTSMQVTDVDEYAALREGYVYGPRDCVQLDVELETIWLRSWTTPIMPPAVRAALGIETPDTAAATTAPTGG